MPICGSMSTSRSKSQNKNVVENATAENRARVKFGGVCCVGGSRRANAGAQVGNQIGGGLLSSRVMRWSPERVGSRRLTRLEADQGIRREKEAV